MFDPETEAIGKCTEALATLEDKAKVRVLRYLANRYELVSPDVGGTPPQNTDGVSTPLHRINEVGQMGQPHIAPSSDGFPVLRDVVKRELAKTEVDWVVVYCFYASQYGEEWFTRQDIIAQFKESGRWTDQRSKNFSANLVATIKRQLIRGVNTTEYQMTDAGREEAIKILEGKSTSISHSTGPRKRKGKNDDAGSAITA